MPPTNPSRTIRLEDGRRRVTNGPSLWRARLRTLRSWPLLTVVAFWAGASYILIKGWDRCPYYANQVLAQPVVSRVKFARVNEARTSETRKAAQLDVPNYFRLDRGLVDAVEAEFRDLFATAKSAERYEDYQKSPQAQRWPLSEEAFAALDAMTKEESGEGFTEEVATVAKRLADQPMILKAGLYREERSTASDVQLDRGDGRWVSVPKESLTYAVNNEHVEALAQSVVRGIFPDALRPALAAIIKRAIVPGPNQFRPVFAFDDAYTRQRIAGAGEIEPVTDTFEVGERLAKSGLLTAEGLALLKSEHAEYVKMRSLDPQLRRQWQKQRAGLVGLVLLLTLGLAVHIRRCQPRILQKPLRAVALAALLLAMLAVDRLALVAIGATPIWSVGTITMTAAVLTLAYSQALAFGAAALLAIRSVLTLESPFDTLLVLLAVAVVTVLSLREIRTRLKMVEVGGLTAVTAAASAIVVGLARQQDLLLIGKESAFGALAALGGTSIILILLPVIERAFGITTSLTLLEWADTSQPILRQLIEQAPGTWQHSHLLGSMAEAAAEEIGANGLLARVGAYYHDIGKICKPNYFVENQSSKISAHQGLAPTMSLLVILAHVKDGLALAREHRLPPVLHRFITEHHGTTLVRYFHARASQAAKSRGKGEGRVSETEFRYPGPKPRSKETAILMLCDGVEGAVRSLQDPTPGRIEGVVHDIVIDRLLDGQFDDCDVTLKELARVEQSLVKSLQAIHHGRIAYPKEDEAARVAAQPA